MEDLQCFFTKAPFTEQILGVPLRFTTNPKTKVIDYIEAGLDLVSQEAVRHLGVTKTLAGDAIQGFLPLYLTHAHFELVKVRCHLSSFDTQAAWPLAIAYAELYLSFSS